MGGCGAAVWQGLARVGLGRRNVGAWGRYDWPTVAHKQKSPPPAVPRVGQEGAFDAIG